MRIFINHQGLLSALTDFHRCQLRSNLCMDSEEMLPVREEYREGCNRASNSIAINHAHFKFSLVVLELSWSSLTTFTEYPVHVYVHIYFEYKHTFHGQFSTFTHPQVVNEDIWYYTFKEHWRLMVSGWTCRVGRIISVPPQWTQWLVSRLGLG